MVYASRTIDISQPPVDKRHKACSVIINCEGSEEVRFIVTQHGLHLSRKRVFEIPPLLRLSHSVNADDAT